MDGVPGVPVRVIAPPLAGEIQVWLTPAENDAGTRYLANGRDCLPENERRRLDGYRSAGAASQFLLGRLLVRRVLGRMLNIPPERLPIKIDANGKPWLAETTSEIPIFSLSHDGGQAMLAVAAAGELGCDMVRLNRANKVQRIAKTYFPAADFRRIETPEQAVAVWAKKEARAKACGHSIWHELGRPLFEGAGTAHVDGWQFMTLLSKDGKIFAVAYRARPSNKLCEPPRVSYRVDGSSNETLIQ